MAPCKIFGERTLELTDLTHAARKLVIVVVVLATAASTVAQRPALVETLGGASTRIVRPEGWNGDLVLLAGGYAPVPAVFRPDDTLSQFTNEIVKLGFAIAETGYSEGGLGIATAVEDVRALRKRFMDRFGTPTRTFVVGESKGGLVGVLLAESVPEEVDGVLTISGLLASPMEFLARAYNLLAAFNAASPDILPHPDRVPGTYAPDEATIGKILDALARQPLQASALREQASAKTDAELAELLAFHTEIVRDVQRRCSGNPFAGSMAADVRRACERSLPGPTGNLRRPLIALETEYDPVIPPWAALGYEQRVRQRKREAFFVRQIMKGTGHLGVATAERLAAFSKLVSWVREGGPRVAAAGPVR